MKNIMLIIVLVFSCNIIFADDYTTADAQASQQAALKEYGQSIATLAQKAQSNANQYLNYAKSVSTTQKAPGEIKKPPSGLMIFVSFSMPDQSLKLLLQQASEANIPVVVRGLVNNSLKDTADRLTKITGEINRGGVLVDPLWFTHFNIKVVPAFVVNQPSDDCPKNMSCPASSFDVVYGDVSLMTALQFLVIHGHIGVTTVQTTLNKLENIQENNHA